VTRYDIDAAGKHQEMVPKQRFWLSWVDPCQDYRPLHDPPNPSILGWWHSGYADDGATICAAVEAHSPDDARDAVILDWPEVSQIHDWRFCEPVAIDWRPNDRFPLADWMVPRFDANPANKDQSP
jgi:hypothetical protein